MRITVRFVLLACMAAVLVLGVRCGGTSRKLVGTWSASTGCGPVSMTFNKDGSGVASGPMGAESFQWKVEGDELVFTAANGRVDRMKFELRENTLVLHSPDGVMTFTR